MKNLRLRIPSQRLVVCSSVVPRNKQLAEACALCDIREAPLWGKSYTVPVPFRECAMSTTSRSIPVGRVVDRGAIVQYFIPVFPKCHSFILDRLHNPRPLPFDILCA